MRNEFKYGLQGLLMAIGFFVVIKLSLFIIEISSEKRPEKNIANVETSSTVVFNSNGKELFTKNCSACHPITRIVDGPTLENITDRVPDRKLLYEWIRNSQKVIQSCNPYFVNQYDAFNKTAMTSFPNLSDKDIDDILEYLDQHYKQLKKR